MRTSILIVGGGTGGVAAALAVADAGGRCVVVEPTDWLGGQLTSQAVPPDEHRWIEGDGGFHGATRRYVAFRDAVRAWYRVNRPLTDAARRDSRLNPGGGWVSRLCFEPAVGQAVLTDMLAPHVAAGRVTLLHGIRPVSADVRGDRIRAVTFDDGTTIEADVVLDATETGDLLPLAGVPFMLGSEPAARFGEMHAPAEGDWRDQQAVTWCFAVSHDPHENHIGPAPAGYDDWKAFVPGLSPPWPGRLFSWEIDDARDPRTLNMVPPPEAPAADMWELWRYRRIVDASVYRPGSGIVDVALWNTVQTDYFRRPLIRPDQPGVDGEALAGARGQAECFLHWLRTDAPRHDGRGTGYPGLAPAGDPLGTADGFAKAVYVREARRMEAVTVVTEAHVGLEQRKAAGVAGLDRCEAGVGEAFADSVGVGHYMIDLHPSAAGRNSVYVPAVPFRVPLGSLVNRTVPNLLAAGKCMGVSHVANGCMRLHPVEWTVGEAAGALAQGCVANGLSPEAIADAPARVADLQKRLVADGFELAWPWEK